MITHNNKARITKEAVIDLPDLEHILWIKKSLALSKGRSPKLQSYTWDALHNTSILNN